jgi:hypothetical protein
MRNERRTSGSGKGAAETCAGNRASAPRPHFHWRRWKRWWDGGYADNSGHDPGVTYDRAHVEVAARVLPAGQADDEEMRLICALKPRDNKNLTDCDEDIPF